METYLKEAGIKQNIAIETDSPVTLRRIIRNGQGKAFFPEKTWRMEEEENIDFLRLDPPCPRSVYIRWNRPDYKNSAAIMFYNFLIEYFKQR